MLPASPQLARNHRESGGQGGTRDSISDLPACKDGTHDGRVGRPRPMVARPKARTTALTGASETCKLSVASPSTGRRALFVTKLAPETTCEDISSHLSSAGVENLKCRRLKTRYDSYSSFHVCVPSKDFGRLSDPGLWPKSCLYKPFRGSLRDELLHECELVKSPAND